MRANLNFFRGKSINWDPIKSFTRFGYDMNIFLIASHFHFHIISYRIYEGTRYYKYGFEKRLNRKLNQFAG